MANLATDYRWQDHVPRLGTVDAAVSAAAVVVLLIMAMAAPVGAPTYDRTQLADASTGGWCAPRQAGPGDDA